MWDYNNKIYFDFYFNKVGKWWNINKKIDIVSICENEENIILGECKNTGKVVDLDVFYNLEKKSDSLEPKYRNLNKYYVLFSLSGFSKKLIKLSEERKDLLLLE